MFKTKTLLKELLKKPSFNYISKVNVNGTLLWIVWNFERALIFSFDPLIEFSMYSIDLLESFLSKLPIDRLTVCSIFPVIKNKYLASFDSKLQIYTNKNYLIKLLFIY